MIVKQMYRYPLMILFPPYFENKLSTSNLQVTKLASGLAIAMIESFIMCPFERLKVYLMTLTHTDRDKTRKVWVNEFKRHSVQGTA
jgi:hypothetical protein